MLKKFKKITSSKHRPSFIAGFTIFFWLIIVVSNINQVLHLSQHLTDEGNFSSSTDSESRIASNIISKYQEDNATFFLIIRNKNGSSVLTEEMYKKITEVEKNITSNRLIGPYLSSSTPYSSIFDTTDNLLRSVLSLQWYSTKFIIYSAAIIWGGIEYFCVNWISNYNYSSNLTSSVKNAEYFTKQYLEGYISDINSSIFLPMMYSFISNFSSLFYNSLKLSENFPSNVSEAISLSSSLIENNKTFFSQISSETRFLDALIFLSSSFNISKWNESYYLFSKTSEFLFNSTKQSDINFVDEVYSNGSLTGFVNAKNKYLIPILRLEKTIPPISEDMIISLLTLFTNYNKTREPDTMIILFNTALSYKTVNGYNLYKEIIRILPLLQKANPSLEIEVTGFDLFIIELTEDSENQAKKMDIIVIVFLIVILILAYRSPILPLIQILSIGIAMVVSRSIFILVSKTVYPLSSTSLILMSINLLGATTDYSVFLIGDYLLMYEKFKDKKKSVKETLERTAKSIVISSISLAIGFGSLIFSRIPSIRGMGIGGAIGFLSGMIVSLTVVPSCLFLIKQEVLTKWKFKKKITPNFNLFNRTQKLVLRRPMKVFLTFTFISALCFGLFFITPLDYSQLSTAPDRYISKQGFNLISEHLGEDKLNQIIILYKTPENESFMFNNNSLNIKTIEKVEETITKITKNTNFTYIYGVSHPLGKPFSESIENTSYFLYQEILLLTTKFILPDSQYALVTCGSPFKEEDIRLDQQVTIIRDTIKELNKDPQFEDWEILVTGFPVTLVDGKRIIQEDFLIISLMILVSSFILLVFFMKDVFMAFRILLTIVISLGLNLGIFAIFAHIFFGGSILFMVPLFLFSVLISLGLDFDILFLGIFNRLFKETGELESSIFNSVKQTMSNISIAGIIMMATYFSLIFTNSIQMIQIGLGLSIGIFIDVFVSRLFIVPSAVILTSKFEQKLKLRRKKNEK
ncbi:MAG: MMPL family transporter [Candidatus Heimdallarchaeum endolithica]|uniref:MMPL family transporter n=1 Tax=Candidatus Heimdallarchaeum endolithica TaxID=2876572 RepID=A0A9Y1BT20_9ARCH|nr:MAG: MMPL family transporter [Candidatus Heimdallarchaeum endolithica]